MDVRRDALVQLGLALAGAGYRFVSTTPETHRRVRARAPGRPAETLRDVFGWNRVFRPEVLGREIWQLCRDAGVAVPAGDGLYSSRVRFSTLSGPPDDFIFVHSAYPTVERDAVFFGPDSYRFASLLKRTVVEATRLVDIGCGTGVGGLVMASRAEHVVLADVSAPALELAAVNVALAGYDAAKVSLQQSDVLATVDGGCDVIISNPPYLVGADDDGERIYRDGGGAFGIGLAVRIVTESLARLRRASGGQLVLYTGTPVIEGRNVLWDALRPVLEAQPTHVEWEELDPDVFGEELDRPAYRDTERLALVGLTAVVEPVPR